MGQNQDLGLQGGLCDWGPNKGLKIFLPIRLHLLLYRVQSRLPLPSLIRRDFSLDVTKGLKNVPLSEGVKMSAERNTDFVIQK